MEVRINKEIKEIREKIYFGLTLRQLLCIVIAAILDVATYFLLHKHIETQVLSWILMVITVPLGFIAFFNLNGLNIEQFIVVWIKSEFGSKKLKVENSNLYIDLLKKEKEVKK